MTTVGEIPTTLLHALADGSCRTIDQLDAELDLSRRQISDGAASLIMRGYLERVETGCYQLTPEGTLAAAHGVVIKSGPKGPDSSKKRKPWRNTLRQRAWNAMRMVGTFTIGELIMAASNGAHADAEGNLGRYIRGLKAAGYIIELPVRQRGTALTSNGFKRYRLLRNTGVIAPVLRPGASVIIDHNLAEEVPCGKPR